VGGDTVIVPLLVLWRRYGEREATNSADVYRWLDHTAEVELELEAPTEREILADALAALSELLAGEEGLIERTAAPLERRTVRAAAGDRPALLAVWLEELIFLSESAGFVPVRLEQLTLHDDSLIATVAGVVGEPRPLVKAVTYHRLEFEARARGYRARVVFDV
jgi:SHS2 domain-containing protein